MQEQEAEIKKVTKAVDSQTGVLQKNASGWKMLMTGFAIKFASEIVDGFKSIISTGLEASRVYEDMSARLTPLVGDLETAQKTFWSLDGYEAFGFDDSFIYEALNTSLENSDEIAEKH